jgi:A/G-specific adenine glycosylase
VRHGYTHFKITLTAFRCEWVAGEAKPASTDALRWVRLDELDDYPFPKANIKVFEAVRNYERMQGNA